MTKASMARRCPEAIASKKPDIALNADAGSIGDGQGVMHIGAACMDHAVENDRSSTAF